LRLPSPPAGSTLRANSTSVSSASPWVLVIQAILSRFVSFA
jgi:hypothetical protein